MKTDPIGQSLHPLALSLSAAILTTVVVGCSTYTRTECVQMDWFKKGREFALQGETAKHGQYALRRSCKEEYGIDLDQERFQAGYENGLKTFCTAEFTSEYAKKGGVYRNTCPADAETAVSQGLMQGRFSFLETQIGTLNSRISTLESENSSLKSEIDALRGRSSSCQ